MAGGRGRHGKRDVIFETGLSATPTVYRSKRYDVSPGREPRTRSSQYVFPVPHETVFFFSRFITSLVCRAISRFLTYITHVSYLPRKRPSAFSVCFPALLFQMSSRTYIYIYILFYATSVMTSRLSRLFRRSKPPRLHVRFSFRATWSRRHRTSTVVTLSPYDATKPVGHERDRFSVSDFFPVPFPAVAWIRSRVRPKRNETFGHT